MDRTCVCNNRIDWLIEKSFSQYLSVTRRKEKYHKIKAKICVIFIRWTSSWLCWWEFLTVCQHILGRSETNCFKRWVTLRIASRPTPPKSETNHNVRWPNVILPWKFVKKSINYFRSQTIIIVSEWLSKRFLSNSQMEGHPAFWPCRAMRLHHACLLPAKP